MFVAGAPVLLPPAAPVLAAGKFAVTSNGATPKPMAKDLHITLDPKDGSLKATWTPEEGEKAPEAKAEDAKTEEMKSAESGAKPETAKDGDAKPEDAKPEVAKLEDAKPEAPKPGAATAKRASVSTDGRASGIFDGKQFGLEGDIRFAIAGSGETATMTAECADGTRINFTLTRVAPDPIKDSIKEPSKDPSKDDAAKPDGGAKIDEPAKTDDAAKAEDAAPADGERPRRGRRGDGPNGAKKPDERENLWKDELPMPFGEYGRLPSQPALTGTVLIKDATIWTLGAQGTMKDGDMLVRDGKIVILLMPSSLCGARAAGW